LDLVYTLLGYLEWVLWAASIGVLLVAVVKRVLGRGDAGRWFIAGLAGIMLAASSSGILSGLYGSLINVVASQPYGWLLPAVSIALMLIGGLYIVAGRLEEGSLHVLGGLLLIGLGAMAIALSTGLDGGLQGFLYVYAWTDRQGYYVGDTVNLTIMVYPGSSSVVYIIAWGDGVVEEYNGGSSIIVTHVYGASGGYTIRVNASSNGLTGYNSLAISVSDRPWEPPWPLDFIVKPILDFSSSFWQAVSMPFNLQLLTTSPRLTEDSGAWGIYTLVLSVSMGGLGLFLGFRLLEAVLRGELRGFLESLREVFTVVLLAYTAPRVYNASIDILNALSLRVIEGVDPMPSVASALALVSAGVGLGFFVPAAAYLAVFIVLVLVTAAALIAIRHWLILSIAASTPLLAVAYLHPGLRGAVRRIIGLWGSMILAGPLTAVFMKTWSIQVGYTGQALTGIFVYAILPNIISLLGGASIHPASGFRTLIHIAVAKLAGTPRTSQYPTQNQAPAEPVGRVRLHTIPASTTARKHGESSGE